MLAGDEIGRYNQSNFSIGDKEMKIARKLSVGGINNIRNKFKNVIERRHVADIWGICRMAEEKTTENMGSYTKFSGEFFGKNAEGEEFVACVCFLPEPAQGMVSQAVIAGLSDSGAVFSGVEFGFRIFVEPDEKSPLGYSYACHSMLDFKPSTALSDLTARLKTLSEPENTKSTKSTKSTK